MIEGCPIGLVLKQLCQYKALNFLVLCRIYFNPKGEDSEAHALLCTDQDVIRI